MCVNFLLLNWWIFTVIFLSNTCGNRLHWRIYALFSVRVDLQQQKRTRKKKCFCDLCHSSMRITKVYFAIYLVLGSDIAFAFVQCKLALMVHSHEAKRTFSLIFTNSGSNFPRTHLKAMSPSLPCSVNEP